MEKESKREIKLIDLIKNQIKTDEKKLIESIDFEKNNEEIIQDLAKHNILNFGDSQNNDKKS